MHFFVASDTWQMFINANTLKSLADIIRSNWHVKKTTVYKIFCHILNTWSWALLFVFPRLNSITPLMSGEVCLRVSLWTVPIFSMRTWELDCKGSPLRLHTGVLRTGADTSHSKQASLGALTSTSCSSLTIVKDWAEWVHRAEGKLY